jgi:hypothetical protein
VPEPSLRDLLDALSGVIRPHLERSEALRHAAAAIGQWLLEEAARGGAPHARADAAPSEEPSAPEVGSGVGPSDEAREVPVRESSQGTPNGAREVARTAVPAADGAGTVAPRAEPAPVPQERVELKLGDTRVIVAVPASEDGVARTVPRISGPTVVARAPVAEPATPAHGDLDLRLVARRCALKAEVCELGVLMRRARAAGAEDAQAGARGHQLLTTAQTVPECVLWGITQIHSARTDAAVLAAAACYRATAAAAQSVHAVLHELRTPEQWRTALQPLASAHSMLRVALHDAGWSAEPDLDQIEVHHWLKARALERRAFLQHMTLAEPADPRDAAAIREDAERRLEERETALRRERRTAELLKKIAYHRRAIEREGAGASEDDALRIIEALHELLGSGVPESDRRVREALGAEVAGRLADRPDLSAPVRRAIAFILAATAGAGAAREDDPPAAEAATAWSPEVLAVREWIAGRDIVIVGGEVRQDAKARIEDAFQCRVEWIAIREHASAEPIRSPATRPGTALVVGLVKLASHAHIEFAREIATAAGKPFVHIPAGYNPERIAHDVEEQIGRRIGLA